MTEYRVVELLAKLVVTKNNAVRKTLALAIGRCALSGSNCTRFGELGVCEPLTDFLRAGDPAVHRSTAYAMRQLSNDGMF